MDEEIALPDAASSGLAYVLLGVAFRELMKVYLAVDMEGALRSLDAIDADLAIRVEEIAALRPADEARPILEDARNNVRSILQAARKADRGNRETVR